MTYKHRAYGMVERNNETKKLDNKFKNHCSKNKTCFVYMKDEIKEVSTDMLIAVIN